MKRLVYLLLNLILMTWLSCVQAAEIIPVPKCEKLVGDSEFNYLIKDDSILQSVRLIRSEEMRGQEIAGAVAIRLLKDNGKAEHIGDFTYVYELQGDTFDIGINEVTEAFQKKGLMTLIFREVIQSYPATNKIISRFAKVNREKVRNLMASGSTYTQAVEKTPFYSMVSSAGFGLVVPLSPRQWSQIGPKDLIPVMIRKGKPLN